MAERDLRKLFLAHRRELEIYLTRELRCPNTAADLLQETFVRVAEQPGEVGEGNGRSYLYRTARNLAIDHFRKEGRRRTRPVTIETIADIPDEAPPIERAAEARERLDLLRRAMAELPERTQQIFTLNRVEGLTYAEIARRLAISESSVQKHLARALHHAMQCLKELQS